MYARLELRWLLLGWIGLVPWIVALDRARSWRRVLGLGLLMSVCFTLAVFGWFALAIRTYTGLPLAGSLVVLGLTGPLVQPQFVVFALARHLMRDRAGGERTGVEPAGDAHRERSERGQPEPAGFTPAGDAHRERSERGQNQLLPAFAGAFLYVGTEWALPKLFGDTLGHGLYASLWMRQGADVAGAPGLSVVLLLANAAAVEAWHALVGDGDALGSAATGGNAPSLRARLRRASMPALASVLLAAGLSSYGIFRLRQLAAMPAGTPLTAGIVQGNVSHYDQLRTEIGTYATVRMVLDTYFDMSDEILRRQPLDLLIWPETVYPTTFGAPKSDDGAAFDREITAFATRSKVPLVFGAYDVEGGAEFNAAFFLEPPASRLVATYRKAWPFPLTERVPAFLDTPRVRAWLPWLGTWQAGAGAKVVPLRLADGRTLHIAPLICYDVLDPTLALAAARAGADVIVTLSNDSWFANGAGPRQHLLGAAFRSIETRRPQLRATNTGISAVITPTGEIIARAGLDERATVVASVVPDARSTTLVVAWGDWLGPVALALGGAILALTLVVSRRRDA